MRASAALGFVWIGGNLWYIFEVDNPESCRSCRLRLKTLSDICDVFFCLVSALGHLAGWPRNKYSLNSLSEESHLCKWLSRAASMLETEWHWRSEHLQLCHSHAPGDPPEAPLEL